jgi:rsbT co-antagonist protein RsbR
MSSQFAHRAPELLCRDFGITAQDLERVQAFAAHAEPRMDEMVDAWYAWLQGRPEFDQFFPEADTVTRVQSLQHSYWQVFMAGDINADYVARRRRVGEVHARIGLPMDTYLAGMNHFLACLRELAESSDMDKADQHATMSSIAKLLHLDTAIVASTYNAMVEDALTAQSRSLLEMSTPVTNIWDGILLLPLVGLIDSRRARDVMNATLEKIAQSQARVFILDISGVGVVDTAVANHLIKISRATRLMGCECVISGLSPAIAQSIVDLGIEVGDVQTTATMKEALAAAFGRLGLDIRQA